MMMMNCFCGMVDRRKAFSLISSRDHCQRSSPSRISDTPWTGLEPAQNLSSGFVEWSYAVVITTTPRRHITTTLWRHMKGLLWKGCFETSYQIYWRIINISSIQTWLLQESIHCNIRLLIKLRDKINDQLKIMKVTCQF